MPVDKTETIRICLIDHLKIFLLNHQMQSFFLCNIIQITFYIVIVISYIILFKCIGSKPIYFEFLRSTFSIDCISNENSKIIVDFHGRHINFSENKKFRVLIKTLVITSLLVVTVIFFDGCILSTIVMDPDGECPRISGSTCFSFKQGIVLASEVFDCPPYAMISSTNATSRIIVCYSWMITSQSVFNVINQLGICASILSLIGFTFRCIYRLASWKSWGTCLIVLLGLALLALLLVFAIVLRATIAYLDLVLLIASIMLLLNALLLVGLVRKQDRKAKLNRIEPIDHPPMENVIECKREEKSM